MTKAFTIALALYILLFSASCYTTQVVSSWSDPNLRGIVLTKIAVVAVQKSDLNRRLFEDEICSQLSEHNVQAQQSYNLMPKQHYTTADSLIDQCKGEGYDGVLISEVVSVRSSTQTAPSTRRYVPETRYHRFGNYYSTIMTVEVVPGVETVNEYVLIQTHLYRSSDGALMWGAQSETERIGDLQMRIEDYTRTVIDDLVQNKFIRK